MSDKLNIAESKASSGLPDTNPDIISDIAPDMMTKVFPYELVNSDYQLAFVQNNTTSIVAISQDGFETNGEFHNLGVDENKQRYFEAIASITSTEVLDIKSSTSAFGLVLKQENQFQIITNQFYDRGSFKPMVATVGKPFNQKEFEAGKQEVFYISRVIPAKGFKYTEYLSGVKEEEQLAEMTFINITELERDVQNGRILFITNKDFRNNVTTSNGDAGITLGIETHTLVHSIKAKGKTGEFTPGGAFLGTEFGDIDLISKEKWAPFKFSATSLSEKLTMEADWFDYDTVMPFIYAKLFKDKKPLSEVIKNADDLKVVEDMLAISSGYASSWDKAPVLTSGGDAGKIDPTFRVGHAGVKAAVIANKNPIDIVDSIFENHIRKDPSFMNDRTRYQTVKGVINALSRFIYSSYAIGKGHNSYNQVYLPWYLEPVDELKYDHKVSIPNPDMGQTGNVDSYTLAPDVRFISKTIYFQEKFSDGIARFGTSDMEIPPHVNMSNQKLVQTDRKLTIPELGATISPVDKLKLPGDINTNTSEAIQDIFYLPIQQQNLWEKFMMDILTQHSSMAPGTRITVKMPQGIDGKIYTQDEANAYTLRLQPGKIVVPTTISQVDSAPKRWKAGNPATEGSVGHTAISNADAKGVLIRSLGIEDEASVTITGNNSRVLNMSFGLGPYYHYDVTYTISHSVFSDAVVETTSTANALTYAYEARPTLFDKAEWKEFLVKFGFLPYSFTKYSFAEKPGWIIDRIDELIIQSVWGNYIEIYFGTGPNEYVKVPLLSKDDESIATQRILFV